jgi:hypothetical protein
MTIPTALRMIFLLLIGTLATAHAQTTVTPLTNAPQNLCCVCTSSTGTTFKVPAQGGSQGCSTACAASGGTATGSTTVCYQGSSGYPAAKYDGPTQCLKSIDGGNCKGNNWCHCGVVRIAIVMDNQKEYPDTETYGEVHIHVGQTLKFHAIIKHFGGTESGGQRVALQKSAEIEIFGPDSSEKHSLPIPPDDFVDTKVQPSFAATQQFRDYTFDKPGTYIVSVHIWGAFKWNGDDGSCSYECENAVNTLAAVRTDGKNYLMWVHVDKPDADAPK